MRVLDNATRARVGAAVGHHLHAADWLFELNVERALTTSRIGRTGTAGYAPAAAPLAGTPLERTLAHDSEPANIEPPSPVGGTRSPHLTTLIKNETGIRAKA